jgi:hypothetical protein
LSSIQHLPGNVILGQDESVVGSADFKFSLTHFFLQSKLALTNKRFAGESPTTLAGLIPVGKNTSQLPLTNIASATLQTRPKVGRLVVGFLLIVLGLALVGESPATLLLSVVGLVLFLGSFKTEMQVTNNAGQYVRLEAVIFERQRLQEFTDLINREVANRL